MTGLFATLLRCEDCRHSVDVHSGSGCAECDCPLTRGAVIESNISIAVIEHAVKFHYTLHEERPEPQA